MTELVRLSSLQRRVVSALHTHGPLARSDLTDLLDVSRSRLSPEVGHSADEKVAREEVSPASTGGRRATQLKLGNDEFGVVAGVDIDAGGVSLVLLHLDGKVVRAADVECEHPPEPARRFGRSMMA